MKSLMLLNGSPRGERSNSMKMLSRVAEGWERGGGRPSEIFHPARRVDFDRAVESFSEADVVLLGMPLYTDAMPGLVKYYIEAIGDRAEVSKTANTHPTLAFLVQSGFPEALHSRLLERYLEKLSRRLGSKYAGTIVRGGGEALQAMPEEATGKLWKKLRILGEQLARDGRFGDAELKAVAGTERYSGLAAPLAAAFCKLPLAGFYWNRQLKRNGARERRFAAPYGSPAR